MKPTAEYITVAEFAKKADVSLTLVYKRMKKDVKPYVKQFKDGKKVDIRALELFQKKEEKPKINESVKQFKTGLNDEFKDHLLQEIEYLKSQIAEKDAQLKTKDEQLAVALKLNENNQVLLQNEQQKLIAISESSESTSLFKRLFGGKTEQNAG